MDRATWRLLAGVGALNLGIAYVLIFAGQQLISSGLAAVVFATFPIWIVLFGRVMLPDQRLTPGHIAAGVLGLTGIGLIQLPSLLGIAFERRVAAGGTLMIGAAILMAIANVILKRSLSMVKPVLSVWGQAAAGLPVLWAITLATEAGEVASWTPRSVGALLYLAVVGTVVTYLLLFWLLPRLPLAALGVIPLLDTLVAVLLGALVLDEVLTWRHAGGAVLILTAAALANLSGGRGPLRGPQSAPAISPQQ